ncbi:Drug/Metabolite Transporter (DMT) Superfamily [Thraustotheca clavata]|uniref:Drug/Metabolite Transporter (DMT) Superfamily n=1 Tax=Thraustotheca clavata TaxID=74557 RepID=A0A1V9YQ56_9STRA|nr:Drug/Metabolite Transporter (DMT) Superfamily [Thraustotheca clavata]
MDVYALDIEALSRIAGVQEQELLEGFQHDATLNVSGNLVAHHDHVQPPEKFNGFLVGVDQLVLHEQSPTETTALLPTHKKPLSAKSKLKMAVRTIGRLQITAKHAVERRKAKFLQEIDPTAFTFTLPAPAPSLKTPRNAYLIPVPDEEKEYILAVPELTTGTTKLEIEAPLLHESMVRRISHLPTDITHVSVETVYENGKDHVMHVQLVVEKKVPFVGYLLLISALVTISSLGAALDLQEGVDPFIKLFWRTAASIVGFAPFAIYSVHMYGWPNWTSNLVLQFLFCCVSYALFLMTFLWSLNHTSIGHAYIFNNCHSLLIVFAKFFTGQQVLAFEAVGSLLGIAGGVVTTMDHTETQSASVVPPSWQGDVVALIGAVGGVFYLLSAKKLRAEIDVFLFMTLLFVVTLFLHFPVFYLLNIETKFWSMDRNIGLFGWLKSDRIGIEMYLVFVCTIIGTMGYISVMKYFDPIVVSVVMLLEPVLATAMGVIVGVDSIPGILTWIGGVLVIAGTCLVILAANKKTEAHDATVAIKQTPAARHTPVYSCTVSKRHRP